MSLTDEDKFFQREDVMKELVSLIEDLGLYDER